MGVGGESECGVVEDHVEVLVGVTNGIVSVVCCHLAPPTVTQAANTQTTYQISTYQCSQCRAM